MITSNYQISADVLSGGTYTRSPVVTVRIVASTNRVPVSTTFGPASGSTNVGTARVATAGYTDEDGVNDIALCSVYVPSAARSANSVSAPEKTQSSEARAAESPENPRLGQIPGGDTSKGLPKKNTRDGSQDPPYVPLPREEFASEAPAPKSSNPSAETS